MKYNSIKPGKLLLDTKGKPIQAHGFSVFYNEKEKLWYWYGENKEDTKRGGTTWTKGIRYYTSSDLYNWMDRGYLIPPSNDLKDPLNPTYSLPHIGDKSDTSFSSQITCVIRLPETDKYVALADRWKPQWYVKYVARQILSGMERHFNDYKPDIEPKEITSVPGKLQKHSENTCESRYVWLPIEWQGDKPVIYWRDEWSIEEF